MKKIWIPLYYRNKDTDAMSELFERLAAKGWHFHKLYAFSALFIRCEKQACRYAVDSLIPLRRQADDENIEEYYEMCRQNGWEYVDGYGQYQIFKEIAGCECIPLQSDPELEFESRYQNEKLNLLTYLITFIVCSIFIYLIFNYLPKSYLFNDFYFILEFIVIPMLLLFSIFKVIFLLFRTHQMKKLYLQTGVFKTKQHLLIRSVFLFSCSLIFCCFILGLIIYEALRGETIHSLPYFVLFLIITLLRKYFEKRNGGRLIKMRSLALVILISMVSYFFLNGLINSIFSLNQPKDEKRVISMIDPDFEGTFTESSSFFIPYQCRFAIDSGNYVYELYIAKDIKSSDLVFDELLMKYTEGHGSADLLKETLEPLQEPYAADGYYLNDDHQAILVQIENSVILIDSNRRLDEPMVIQRFNEQLNSLNRSASWQ